MLGLPSLELSFDCHANRPGRLRAANLASGRSLLYSLPGHAALPSHADGERHKNVNLKSITKSLINQAIAPWGMELAYTHALARLADYDCAESLRGAEDAHAWLRSLPVRTVLDIGANTGQFASKVRELLPEAFIYSFEPLRDPYASLLSRMEGDRLFRAFNFAVGAQDARATIHRSQYSPASSLLPMHELHRDAWPQTADAVTEEIEVRRLDSFGIEPQPELLVKIDVQGFEDKVIEGGRETLGRAAYVITEVSFARLYEGQPLFEDIYRLLTALGFRYRGALAQLLDPREGRPLQADAFFAREGGGG